MTLLGGIELGDRVLLGADGIVYETNSQGQAEVRRVVPKVWQQANPPGLLWGFTGDESVGLEFNRWFEGRSFDSWDDLRRTAGERVATFNGDMRRTAATAETEREPIEVLIAGYITRPGVVHIYDDGGALAVKPQEPVFLGGGRPHSYTAWAALRLAFAPREFDPGACFRQVLQAAVSTLPALGEPVTVLECLSP